MEPSPAHPTEDERNWAVIAHAGPVVAIFVTGGTLGWLVPLVIYLMKGEQSAFARAHSVEALNFQITLWIAVTVYAVLSAPLICVGVGILLLAAVPLVYVVPTLVLGIRASLAAGRGEPYQYPYTLRLVS